MKRLACFDNLVRGESESPKDEVKPVVAKVEPKETDLVIEEDVSKYFQNVSKSPYMLLVCDIKNEIRKKLSKTLSSLKFY